MQSIIPVFIASPSDVSRERKLTKSAVEVLAPRLARLYGVTLVPMMWEEFAPISSYDAAHPQIGFLELLKPFSIFVGVLWERYGTTVGDTGRSGTDVEFNHALIHRDRISILSYFRVQTADEPADQEMLGQRNAVNILKEELHENRVNSKSYKNVQEFQKIIMPDLMEAALKLILSEGPKKVGDYVKFFRFGSHALMSGLPLLIAYEQMTDPGSTMHWQQRLLPHLIYEDAKAIQDVEEAMRLLGRRYTTVTTDSSDIDNADLGDRVWVCVPRNEKAKRVLRGLGDRVRFKFNHEDIEGRSECILSWKDDTGKWRTIRSPLKQYLKYSNRPSVTQPWKPLYGYLYARDYAILARFRVFRDPECLDGEFFYHYFIGGIRGLGTWGVGHLIDHESASLVAMAESSMKQMAEDDVQLLLEVTYENYRVTSVRDVSHELYSYFTKHSKDSYIRSKLGDHHKWLPAVSE